MQELYQIGDVARLFHISVGSLRHYEQVGLLKPEYIDSLTGYRYYSTRQFEILNTIRYLRVLDMPLNQIADFLQNKDISVIEDKLLKQKETVIQKQQELKIIERKIDHRLQQLHDAINSKLNTIYIKKYSSFRIVWMHDSISPKTYLDLEHSIRHLDKNQVTQVVFLGKVGIGISKEDILNSYFNQYSYIFLVLDAEDEYVGNVEIFPEETCASIRFCGSHKESPEYYQKLLSYINDNNLKISGFSKEITMIDYGITNDTSKFVTEIRIPVTY